MERYLADHRERTLEQLVAFASFPSVSALEEHRGDVLACAAWLVDHLSRIGLGDVRLIETDGNPIAFAQWLGAGSEAPTVLIYGHYDVQPADPIELWTTPPFTPTVRDGEMYARGISDNKGQVFAALAAIEAALAVWAELPCNVKVLVEGEEEHRADLLDDFVGRSPDLLAADLLLNTDSVFAAPGVPTVPVGVRGMVALGISLEIGGSDLHSGLFGGIVLNAVQVLAALIASLKDSEGRVAVEGFYDDVAAVPPAELASWSTLDLPDGVIRAEARVRALVGEPGFTTLERLWARPTLDVVGLWGGFQGPGLKTVIPARAHAKISCRLVADQRTEDILEKVAAHLRRRTPDGAELTIDWTLAGAPAMLTSADHPAVRAALDALEDGFGQPAAVARMGASVPVNEIVHRHLGMSSVMLGFSAPSDAFHAPDEHLSLERFDAGVRTVVGFLRRYAASATG